MRVKDIAVYHRELTAKDYRHCKPGIEDEPWGARVMKITDPFGNRLLFNEPTGKWRAPSIVSLPGGRVSV